jgi:hypothetical protein
MERREFLKYALGVAAGAAAFAASATAAPLTPQPLNEDAKLPANPEAQPAITSREEADRLAPEEVQWGYRRRWARRRWRWRRRYWRRRRYVAWRRRRRWRRRYWRRRYW